MNEQVSVCPVCGCAVAGVPVCPLCGAAMGKGEPSRVLQAHPPEASAKHASTPAAPAGSAKPHGHRKPERSRRGLFLGLAVAAAIVVAVGAVAAFLAWTHDQDLRQRAEGASSPRGVVQVRAERDPLLGNASGSLAGGGVVVPDGDARYWATANGVYRQEDSSKAGSSLQLVASDRAACLNLHDGALYYLAGGASSAGGEFEGREIRVLRDPLPDADGPRTPEVLYRADGQDVIGSLAVRDGLLYFVAEQGDERIFMEMPCDGSQEANELARSEAEDAWLFVEDDALYAVSTTAASWSVEVKRLGDDGADFRKWGSGSGRLKAACVSGGMLYYSLSQGAGASHLHRQDATGGFSEYPGVAGVLNIAADGDVVACVGQTGSLMWVHATTGFDYDLGDVMEKSLENPVPGLVGLGVAGDSICCVDDAGSSFAFNVNSGESAVLS